MDEVGQMIGLIARLNGATLQALHEAGLLSPERASECAEDLMQMAQILDGHTPDTVQASPLAASLHRIGLQIQGSRG